jgi:hypothetical protein
MLEFSHSLMATLLAPIAHREIDKAYGSHAAAWRPLTRRTDPTIGRKRRARRARGRRIEARQNIPYIGGRTWLARATFARVRAGGAPLPRVMMLDEVDSFPTGELTVEQWAAAHRTMQGQQGEAHEADQDPR